MKPKPLSVDKLPLDNVAQFAHFNEFDNLSSTRCLNITIVNSGYSVNLYPCLYVKFVLQHSSARFYICSCCSAVISV